MNQFSIRLNCVDWIGFFDDAEFDGFLAFLHVKAITGIYTVEAVFSKNI